MVRKSPEKFGKTVGRVFHKGEVIDYFTFSGKNEKIKEYKRAIVDKNKDIIVKEL